MTELGTQTIDADPKENSLNELMSHTGLATFSIELDALANYLIYFERTRASVLLN